MYTKYAWGFLLAAFIQAVIIIAGEFLNISNLNPDYTVMQFVTHFLTGLIVGYIILFIMRKVDALGKANTWLLGITFGVLVWAINLTIQSNAGNVNAPWQEGTGTVIVSLIAFITFGYLAVRTVKKHDYEEVKEHS